MEMLARNWGWIVLRGVIALLFGLVAVGAPALTFATLVLLFGMFALLDGIFAVIASIAHRKEQPRWGALLAAGILAILVGIVTLAWPGVTAIVLVYMVAIWAIGFGIAEIVAAIRLRQYIKGEWLMILAGLVSIVFGVVITLFPGAGAVALVIWIGITAVILGILRIALGFRLRSWGKQHPVS